MGYVIISWALILYGSLADIETWQTTNCFVMACYCYMQDIREKL